MTDWLFHGAELLSAETDGNPDGDKPAPGAVAITGGRVAAVGDPATVREAAAPDATHVDLGGATLGPSFKDHHVHLLNVGSSLLNGDEEERMFLELSGLPSRQAVIERVAARAREVGPGEWIIGKGWNQHDWGEDQLPDLRELSDAVPDQPVFLGRVDAHCAWVNEAALQAAGIDADTPEFPGGAIRRGVHGNPTGILLERAAEPVLRQVPERPGWKVREAFARAARRMASLGVTSVCDAGFLSHAAIVNLTADLDLYLELLEWADAEDELPLEIRLMVPAPSPLSDRIVTDPERYREISPGIGVTHLKIHVDGAFGSRGAFLTQPYADDPSTAGVQRMTPGEIQAQAHRAVDAGLDLAAHAIGDAAVRDVLDAYETLLAGRTQIDPRRLRIEHFGYASEHDIRRAADLGVLLAIQPNFVLPDSEGVPMEERRLGSRNCDRCYPWNTLWRLGANLAGSTDCFATPGPALGDFYAAATRMSPTGVPEDGWQPQERLSRRDSLDLVTRWWPAGGASPRGSRLTRGESADLVVLSANPLEVAESEILDIRVQATLRRGELTFTDGSLELPD